MERVIRKGRNIMTVEQNMMFDLLVEMICLRLLWSYEKIEGKVNSSEELSKEEMEESWG